MSETLGLESSAYTNFATGPYILDYEQPDSRFSTGSSLLIGPFILSVTGLAPSQACKFDGSYLRIHYTHNLNGGGFEYSSTHEIGG